MILPGHVNFYGIKTHFTEYEFFHNARKLYRSYINSRRRIRLLGTVGDQLAQKNVNIKISSAALMQFVIFFSK